MNAKNDSDYKRKCLALLDTLGGMELPVYLDVYRKIAVGGGMSPTSVAAIDSCDAFFLVGEEDGSEEDNG